MHVPMEGSNYYFLKNQKGVYFNIIFLNYKSIIAWLNSCLKTNDQSGLQSQK